MLRVSTPADVDFVDTALAYSRAVVADRVRDVREAVQLPGRARCGRNAARDGGRRPVHGLEGRANVHVRAEADVPLPHGRPVTAQSFADAFDRVAHPKLGSPATAFMREIVGAAAVIDGQAHIDLRRAGARPLPVADPADQAGGGLHRPADDCRSSARPAEHADQPGRDRQPARVGPLLRRRADRQPADRAETQPLLPRRAPGERRPGRLDDRRYRRLPARRRAGPDGLLLLRRLSQAPFRALAEKYGINRPGGQFFVSPLLATWFVTFNHERSAFKGRGQIPLKKAINFAIDRPALAARVRLPRRQAHRPDAAPGARPLREHLPARGRRPCDGEAVAGPGEAPAAKSSSSTRATAHPGSH